jgi:isochorismate synthase
MQSCFARARDLFGLFIYEVEMEAAISSLRKTDRTGKTETPATRTTPDYHELLLNTLREASWRAAHRQHPVLASFTRPYTWHDPLHVFVGATQAALGACFFWERPAEQHALIGTGAATTIETGGDTRFSDAAAARRALLSDAVVIYAPETARTASSGPVLCGGFSFDPHTPRTQLWADFPDGLLILPQILLSYSLDQTTLTVNRMIRATDDVEQCTREIIADIELLQAAVERVPSSRQESGEELSVQDVRPAAEWMTTVENMVARIRQGDFDKVVLARDIRVTRKDAGEAFDIGATLQRLRESYPAAYIFALQRGRRFFVGATPEQLVRSEHGQVQTMALAGSARRGENEEEDTHIGMELLQSQKNTSEHAIVVAMVQAALKNHCTSVSVSSTPRLLKLQNVQHLKTSISGELLPGRCILDLLADLHPTPAVGGFPRQEALAAIRETELLDRGWYAAPLGWINVDGHGEFAVALRSGLIDGSEARLFAGCGIVADSDPEAEFAESCLKFQVMLRALTGSY